MNNTDYIELAGCRSVLSKIESNHGIIRSPWENSVDENIRIVQEFLDFHIKSIEHIIENEKEPK